MLFFKTRTPVEPVSFVRRICLDAAESLGTQRHRWIRRLTPMTRMGKATEKGLEEVSKAVLGPAFHQEGGPSKKGSVCFVFVDNATQYMQHTHHTARNLLLPSYQFIHSRKFQGVRSLAVT